MKKRQRDFKDRQLLKEESNIVEKEENKLKHSDDYRSKIIHDNEKYQDKVISNKKSLMKEEDESDSSKTRRIKTSEEEADRINENDEKTLKEDKEETEEKSSYESSSHQQSKTHKRRNYKEDFYTRKKESPKKGEEKKYLKEKSSNEFRKQAKENINKKKMRSHSISHLSVFAKGSEVARDYLSVGSDENAGIESGEKTMDQVSKLSHKARNYSAKRKQTRAIFNEESKLRKRKSKLEFRRARDDLIKSEEYKSANVYKRFQKKRQVKAAISKHNGSRIRDRIKREFLETVKSGKDFIVKKSKLLLGILGIFVMFSMLLGQLAGAGMGGMANTSSGVLTTSYLSGEQVLKDINSYFSSLESDIQSQIDNIESNHPGYDEYLFEKNGDVGHNVHELLSYITSRYGEVKSVSEVQGILDELFNAMYDVSYREEVEIRYKTVTTTYIDENGDEITETHEEPYEYKKLIMSLNKKEMDSVIRSVFSNYPDNIAHYEALLSARGNMEEAFGNTDLILANGGVGGGKEYEASSDVQKRIVNAAYMTPSPGPGWCAMWVSQVYQNAGLGYLGGNANDMYRNFTFTSDKSKLQVGMVVAVESSSSGGSLGATYGHVGIYIGDGKVMDNIGVVRVTTLDDWIATFCQHHPVGFGFPPNVQR